MTHLSQGQLGFDALLQTAQAENEQRQLARQTAHLPETMDAAIAHYRVLLRQHHAAMLAANVEQAMALREEAHLLAVKLNGGAPGILAGESAPGCVLERETAAVTGAVPLWGQCGAFTIEAAGMRVRIEMDGIFGIGAHYLYWPGFAAHPVDWDKPFLSETGYRSFLGIQADPAPGLLPDAFAARLIEAHVRHALKGKLRAIAPRYRDLP